MLWREEGTFPGEPIFVPRPGGVREDDGVLLSVVLAGLPATIKESTCRNRFHGFCCFIASIHSTQLDSACRKEGTTPSG